MRLDVTAIQKTRFVCDVVVCVMSSDFVGYSAHGVKLARVVCLLVNRAIVARVDLVHVDDR